MMKRQRLVSQPEEVTSIKDLPEDILVHIISLLTLEDAVITSVVAESWRNLWLSVPTLSFDMDGFNEKISEKSNLSSDMDDFEEGKTSLEVCEQFCEFISNTLRRRPQNLALQKFRLYSVDNHETLQKYVDSWLQLLVKAKVVELDLDFALLDDPLPTISPLFFLQSVEVLKLSGIEFLFPKEALPLRLESIREVHLSGFSSTDKDIAHMLASCAHLETLSLVSSDGFMENLKIASKQLKHLKLGFLNTVLPYWDKFDEKYSVEICAPSLISLDLVLVYANKFCLKQRLSSLVEAKVRQHLPGIDFKYWTNVVSYLSGVERLTIETIWPYDRLQPEGLSETFIFRNLKHVELSFKFSKDDILGMESILKRCPLLATMVLESTYEASNLNPDDFPKGIVFHVPHLRLVEIKGYKKTEMEMYIVQLLKKHGLVLEKIVAYLANVDGKSQPPIVL